MIEGAGGVDFDISQIFLCPNPICSSDSEEQMVGRSNATSTKFMRLLKEQINLCAETTAIL